MPYKCETCARKLKNSNGHYVRCAQKGNVKKRTECDKYADVNKKFVPVTKVSFIDAIEMGVV